MHDVDALECISLYSYTVLRVAKLTASLYNNVLRAIATICVFSAYGSAPEKHQARLGSVGAIHLVVIRDTALI